MLAYSHCLQASTQSGGQSTRDELFGGRRDVEAGASGRASTAEAKLDEADRYQDKTEEAYKVGSDCGGFFVL